jgi:hypothetical protein
MACWAYPRSWAKQRSANPRVQMESVFVVT